MAHSHQAHILVAPVEGRHIQAVLADLQVAAAVDDLWGEKGRADSAEVRKGSLKEAGELKRVRILLGHICLGAPTLPPTPKKGE